MAHEHSIYDNDKHFVIDPATRLIENTSGKVTLMQHDHNSERFTFELPRFIDGHDMSLCNKVVVHYINAKADKTDSIADAHIVKDLQISPDSDDVVIFSWLIDKKATTFNGTLAFVVSLMCLDDEGNITYRWGSAKHTGISVGESIDNAESIEETYGDIISQWEARLDALENGGVGGGITEETDPTVPDWAKQKTKPSYTAEEVGALPNTITPLTYVGMTSSFIDVSQGFRGEDGDVWVTDDYWDNTSDHYAYIWLNNAFRPLGTKVVANIGTTDSRFWDRPPSVSAMMDYVRQQITAYDTEAMALLGEDGDGE